VPGATLALTSNTTGDIYSQVQFAFFLLCRIGNNGQ
jgi:hypothetical protein